MFECGSQFLDQTVADGILKLNRQTLFRALGCERREKPVFCRHREIWSSIMSEIPFELDLIEGLPSFVKDDERVK